MRKVFLILLFQGVCLAAASVDEEQVTIVGAPAETGHEEMAPGQAVVAVQAVAVQPMAVQVERAEYMRDQAMPAMDTVRDAHVNARNIGQEAFVVFAATNAAVTAAATAAVYKNNEKFRQFINDHAGHAKNFLIRSVAVPVYMKVEEIKDEGISKKDIVNTGIFFGSLYGIKKFSDSFHIWRSVRSGDYSKTKEAMGNFFRFLYSHKGKIAAVSACVALGFFVWKLSKAYHKMSEISLFDQFFLSLTSDQRLAILQAPHLSILVSESQSEKDPSVLQADPEFMALLHDEQRKKLHNAVEDYYKNNSFEYLQNNEQK